MDFSETWYCLLWHSGHSVLTIRHTAPSKAIVTYPPQALFQKINVTKAIIFIFFILTGVFWSIVNKLFYKNFNIVFIINIKNCQNFFFLFSVNVFKNIC